MISTGVVCREFIGRTIELEFLVERVLRLPEGRGGSLVIKGGAGIGKSRLARELIDASRRAGIRCVETACPEFGDAPYAPVIALADALAADGVAERLRSAGDGSSNARHQRSLRFSATATAFAESAQRAPFVAVVEDLHWAAPASLELLHHLISALHEYPAVFVLTERGDEPATDSTTIRLLDTIEREADATLTLDSLTPDEIKALIASALRDDGRRIPAVAVEEISALSDGRPFHAEELLRGMLERTAGPKTAGDSLVPRSLRASVVERLAIFDDRERVALAHSAVIGSRFETGLLAELLEVPERELLPVLRKARNAQLIVEEADGGGFSFRHALTREVVYDQILRVEARLLHGRIARELIERGGDPVPIAHHAWRSGDDALTYAWNMRCGDDAAAVFAHVDAIRHYDRAYRSAPDAQNRSLLAERLGQAYYAIGELAEAVTWFGTSSADATADTDRARRLALEKARALFEAGEVEAGIAQARAIVDALARVDSAVRFEAETLAAALLNMTGQAQEAYAHLRAADELTSERDPRWAARHRGILAHALHGLGRVAESSEAYVEAEAAVRAIGDREALVRTLNNAAHLKAACGDVAGAVASYTGALAVARELNAGRLVAWVQQNLAYSFALLGRFDDALEACHEAQSIDHGVAIVSRWLTAIATRIGTLTDNASLARPGDVERALDDALANRDDQSAAITAGAALLQAQALGENGDALAERYLAGTVQADGPWIAEAAARLRPDLAAKVRARIAAAASPEYALGMQATLALLDARIAVRERRRGDADGLAKRAVEQFKSLGWPLEEAYARELRGGVKEAVEIFRRIGARTEAARLTNVAPDASRRRGESTLTTRESEIARLVANGKSNREVAEALVISERTVETHVASIYGKLGVTNRKDLVALLKPSP
ncbi:MAG: AAA family ATPase [Candidatus Velthaea sp.]